MAWFVKPKYNIKKSVMQPMQEGLWFKCPQCSDMIYNEDWEKNLKVCPKCGYHDRMNAFERIKLLIDPGTFKETHNEILSGDPLDFFDGKQHYSAKYEASREKTHLNEGVVTGYGAIHHIEVQIAVMDFSFMGGSMGSAIGEKITLAIEEADKHKRPLIISCASGGARMQEGILSLMQMAKTSAALKRFHDNGGLYIALLTHPTSGGVTASFAMLGDFIVAEPGALIAFAGPRIIEQMIRQKLPEGFQRAQFLQEHGFVDMVVPRGNLRQTLFELLQYTQ